MSMIVYHLLLRFPFVFRLLLLSSSSSAGSAVATSSSLLAGDGLPDSLPESSELEPPPGLLLLDDERSFFAVSPAAVAPSVLSAVTEDALDLDLAVAAAVETWTEDSNFALGMGSICKELKPPLDASTFWSFSLLPLCLFTFGQT
jgi:hypothetical protein